MHSHSKASAAPPVAWLCGLSADRSWALIYDRQLHNIAEIHRPALPTGLDDVEPMPFEQAVLLMRCAPQLAALLRELVAASASEHYDLRRRGDILHRANALLCELSTGLRCVACQSGDAHRFDHDTSRECA